jgi:hypothetical protein
VEAADEADVLVGAVGAVVAVVAAEDEETAAEPAAALVEDPF